MMITLGAQIHLDRMSARRSDPAWIAHKLAEPATRFILLIDLKPAILSGAEPGMSPAGTMSTLRYYSHTEIQSLGLEISEPMFLGQDSKGNGLFALAFPEDSAKRSPAGPAGFKPYVDLRTLATQGALTPEQLSLAGQARSLANWHQTHGFCSQCGGKSAMQEGGWKRRCSACQAEHFPRTDPVVIMLVTDGERCLLGHEKRFGQMYGRKFYSTLAGFLESGEDIEAAVRREVWEEVGIPVDQVHYHCSQPWPFPYSLMIGCIAQTNQTALTIDKAEIEDAQWFSRDDARAALAGTHPELGVPGKHAIAHHLIAAFVDGTWGRAAI